MNGPSNESIVAPSPVEAKEIKTITRIRFYDSAYLLLTHIGHPICVMIHIISNIAN